MIDCGLGLGYATRRTNPRWQDTRLLSHRIALVTALLILARLGNWQSIAALGLHSYPDHYYATPPLPVQLDRSMQYWGRYRAPPLSL